MTTEDRSGTGLQARVVVRHREFVLDARLSAAAGEVVALLGPNGAGKSTMVRTIAGLRGLDDGRIQLGDQVLDDVDRRVYVAPAARGLGVVFQNHRLLPFLSVLDNVAFGVRANGVRRQQARAIASGWLERFGLSDYATRKPAVLSGGQAQRVALARALAIQPRALLLDEPLAALDVQTRSDVQDELRRHLVEFAGPTLLVTHDPVEALLLANRIVVLENGAVVQDATPQVITAQPATPYVARLVGVNLIPGEATGTRVRTEAGAMIVLADPMSGPVNVVLRPSALTVHAQAPAAMSARNVWSGVVSSLSPVGDRIRLVVQGPVPLLADVTQAAVAELGLVIGRQVWLSAKATDLEAHPRHVVA